ncbi:monooxygenase [Rhodococcus opacus]|nr:monooxygenase [Rhodococcus opacus]RZL77186.1 MAG: monooxygenase [Rhodococcus sp. (in: high G+C Gram-positive bacteria)]
MPGSSCPPGNNFPGYDNIHVAVQRRGAPGDVLGLCRGDAASARWVLDCKTKPTPTGLDITGPYVQGRPGARFVYLSWGTVDGEDGFDMFRRAKLMWDGVDPATAEAASAAGRITARLGLTDARGNPLCAAVRPPLIEWSA